MAAQDDEGSVAIFFVLFLTSAFLLAGLVIDGGLAIDGRGRAADAAEQAARFGADQLDVPHLRATGVPLIEAGNGPCDMAKSLLASYGQAVQPVDGNGCVVSADRTTITIRVQTKVETTILGIIGYDHFTVGAKAVAHPVAG